MSVFRELFVEVPIALLEARVHAAQAQEAPPKLCREIGHPDVYWPVVREFGERFGWTPRDYRRQADRQHTTVYVHMKCRHVGWFVVDDEATALMQTRELVDYLYGIFKKEPEHKCKCGEPQGLGPAGRPR